MVGRPSRAEIDARAGLPPRGLRLPQIVTEASILFDVPADSILGRRQDELTTRARHAVFWAAYETGKWSFATIGMGLERDWSTVRYGVLKIEKQRRRDRELLARTNYLRDLAMNGRPPEPRQGRPRV